MKITAIVLTLVAMMFCSVAYAEKAPQKIVDLGNSTLAAFGSDPVIVEAVKAENAKGKTLDQIKAQDVQWQASVGVTDYMKALMESDCGKYLQKIQKSAPYYSEIFVTDNQGANVAMTDKTSDYWQGDEAKFTKSFAGGSGAVFVDEVKFDDSAQTYLVQISVPVLDDGKAIGSITFGIDVDAVE
ncbi:PDC sensor domain-containing protein [Desulfogranum japonicum]|uniref:PDC sensor domain-containing protein n=1 Tax=Desulfogranum japonicum TaxID=231447 RepID=UPI0004132528|nr:PDC sensor domain-containing protein [Desulfogranum japonicum]